MTHFNEAMALLVVCQRSMVATGDVAHDAVHEEIVIRAAITKFKEVYEEIDEANSRIRALWIGRISGHVPDGHDAADRYLLSGTP